jgi:hypothetical protein
VANFIKVFYDFWAPITLAMSVLFVVVYSILSPWWKSPFGRALVAMESAIGVATVPVLIRVYFRSYNTSVTEPILLIALVVIPLIIAYRIVILLRTHFSAKYQHLETPTPQQDKDPEPELKDQGDQSFQGRR